MCKYFTPKTSVLFAGGGNKPITLCVFDYILQIEQITIAYQIENDK